MDRVQRDQCRLLINLSEFQIHRLAPREWGEEEKKSKFSSPGKEGPACFCGRVATFEFALAKVNWELGWCHRDKSAWIQRSETRIWLGPCGFSFTVKEEYVNALNSQAFQPTRKRIRGIQESWPSCAAELHLEPILTCTAWASSLK